jgi:hypothetical protein
MITNAISVAQGQFYTYSRSESFGSATLRTTVNQAGRYTFSTVYIPSGTLPSSSSTVSGELTYTFPLLTNFTTTETFFLGATTSLTQNTSVYTTSSVGSSVILTTKSSTTQTTSRSTFTQGTRIRNGGSYFATAIGPAIFDTVVIAETNKGEILIVPTTNGIGMLTDLCITTTSSSFVNQRIPLTTGWYDSALNSSYTFEEYYSPENIVTWTVWGGPTATAAGGSDQSQNQDFQLVVPAYFSATEVNALYAYKNEFAELVYLPPLGVGLLGFSGNFSQKTFTQGLGLAPIDTEYTQSSKWKLRPIQNNLPFNSSNSFFSALVWPNVIMPTPSSTITSSNGVGYTLDYNGSNGYSATTANSSTSGTTEYTFSAGGTFSTISTRATDIAGGNPYLSDATIGLNNFDISYNYLSPALYQGEATINAEIQTWNTNSIGSSTTETTIGSYSQSVNSSALSLVISDAMVVATHFYASVFTPQYFPQIGEPIAPFYGNALPAFTVTTVT